MLKTLETVDAMTLSQLSLNIFGRSVKKKKRKNRREGKILTLHLEENT